VCRRLVNVATSNVSSRCVDVRAVVLGEVSTLCLGLPSGLFPSAVPTKFVTYYGKNGTGIAQSV
jgi:hypothetical protein